MGWWQEADSGSSPWGESEMQNWWREMRFYPQHHVYGQNSTETTGCEVTEDSHHLSVEDMMIPQGSWTREKPGKTFIQGFFEPYNFPKGWGQVSNKYIQHIYSYSTLSNHFKAQHGQGNEFANTIGTHQRSLHNCSGNDAISRGLRR